MSEQNKPDPSLVIPNSAYVVVMSAIYYHGFFGLFETVESARQWTEAYVAARTTGDGDGHHDFAVHRMSEGPMQYPEECAYVGSYSFNSLGKRIPSYEWSDSP